VVHGRPERARRVPAVGTPPQRSVRPTVGRWAASEHRARSLFGACLVPAEARRFASLAATCCAQRPPDALGGRDANRLLYSCRFVLVGVRSP
jgi:hypothetical protein